MSEYIDHMMIAGHITVAAATDLDLALAKFCCDEWIHTLESHWEPDGTAWHYKYRVGNIKEQIRINKLIRAKAKEMGVLDETSQK